MRRFLLQLRRPLFFGTVIIWISYNAGSSWHGYLEFLANLPAMGYVAGAVALAAIYWWWFKRLDWLWLVVVMLFAFNVIDMMTGGQLVKYEVKGNLPAIKVCSWNTAYFFHQSGNREIPLQEWASQQCDIYLLQEVWAELFSDDSVRQRMEQFFPGYHYAREGEFVTISRLPIIESTLPYHDGFWQSKLLLSGSPETNDAKYLDVFNTHIWYPFYGRGCRSFIQQTSSDCPNLSAFTLRHKQATELLNQVKQAQAAGDYVLIAGDFNAMPNHYLPKALGQLTQDIRSTNWLANFTFTAKTPLLKIDYMFVDKKFTNITSYRKECFKEWSDHCRQEIVLGR